jgi:hypothetical protein
LGGGMVGTHAGDMIGEIAQVMEKRADIDDTGKSIHLRPKLGESSGVEVLVRMCLQYVVKANDWRLFY